MSLDPALSESGLVERVRHRLVAESGGDSTDIAAAVRAESRGIVDDSVFDALRRGVAAELHGAGPLEPLLAIEDVTDVLVNAPDQVWIDRGNRLERVPVRFVDDGAVRRLAQRLAMAAGHRLDDAMPYADAVLPDGTRLHAVLPPLAAHPTLSLRVLARRPLDLDALLERGTFSAAAADVLRAVIDARLAFVITGGTGTGKTTLLAALLSCVNARERIVLIEDAPELVASHPHLVRLMARTANVEGVGAIGMRELVRQALRMRPDRLVVGEFRGAEMADLLVALNTGHEGGAATMHANSASDAPARFAALGALAGLSAAAVTPLVACAFDLVIHLRRGQDGRRALAEIAMLDRDGDELVVRPAWASADGVVEPQLSALLAARAVSW